jgi:hypothetical protein
LKIQAVIPLWKRYEITKFCFKHLQILIAEAKHEIDVLCVISEPEYIPICNSFGFKWVYAENDPLGAKINVGVKKALSYKPDYIMTMNSDSVVKSELLNVWYQPSIDKREEFFGVDTVTFLDSKTNDARDYTYDFSILGVAKMIRADIVERCLNEFGKLYEPHRNRGLDDTMMDNLVKLMKCSPHMIKYKGQLVYDVKSDVNIWSFEHFQNRGKKVESKLCYKVESDAENLTER